VRAALGHRIKAGRMIWHIVLVILFGGQQVELVGAEQFNSHAECKEQHD
jgi:hypothetical protein